MSLGGGGVFQQAFLEGIASDFAASALQNSYQANGAVYKTGSGTTVNTPTWVNSLADFETHASPGKGNVGVVGIGVALMNPKYLSVIGKITYFPVMTCHHYRPKLLKWASNV